ncbi:flavonol 3-O-glucosyltransferase UGT89B1-like [Impatiens glandulifera]|uniref:flavonol 3-O-glucosyltransferase UGT89B1-like n=1 Tax=Impatiens glandulifera TaxID=253017 RepID=UPI001FB06665|nr:flavonol 3-O-glucosyltransferase UGT89B1-like [Impatiens glandulifera]
MTSSSPAAAHILVFPFPSPGHIIPLLDLIRQLLNHGLTITVLVTPSFLSLLDPLISSTSSLQFHTLVLPISAAFSAPHARLIDKVRGTADLYQNIVQWFLSHPSPPVAIISDFFLGWTQRLSEQLGIKRIVFWPSGAFTASVNHSMWKNLPKNDSPDNDEFLVRFPEVPTSPVYPWWQITQYCRNYKEGDPYYEFFREGMVLNSESWGFVFNSFEELEGVYVDYLKKLMGHNRVWTVGPLLPDSDESLNRGGSSSIPITELMGWLDSKEDGSVLYISFGSRIVLSNVQMAALAEAIELSGVSFIWCVKDRKDSEMGLIPDGFVDRTSEKGLIVRGWAPQVAILRHRALGAFLSHCGWNSVLEGIDSGVPMIAWPIGADQFTNAKLLVDNLGVAIRGCEGGDVNVPDVNELSLRITESMLGGGGDCDGRRERVRRLSEAARKAVGENGGSSIRDLNDFVCELNNLQDKTGGSKLE